MNLAVYASALDSRRQRALRARQTDRGAILRRAAYQDALDRLRDAQGRYELSRDDRASDAAVRDAIRDVLVARADLEHIRRNHPEVAY